MRFLDVESAVTGWRLEIDRGGKVTPIGPNGGYVACPNAPNADWLGAATEQSRCVLFTGCGALVIRNSGESATVPDQYESLRQFEAARLDGRLDKVTELVTTSGLNWENTGNDPGHRPSTP